MSITRGEEGWSARGKDCFLCYAELKDPAIHWSGCDGDIYLHPECVMDLALRMFRDVHELQCKSGYGLSWARRSTTKRGQ